MDIGVTRNENVVEYERVAAIARTHLNEISPRVMAVLRPLKVTIIGLGGVVTNPNLVVPDFPFDIARGSHTVTIEDNIYIDSSDFRLEYSEVAYACVV